MQQVIKPGRLVGRGVRAEVLTGAWGENLTLKTLAFHPTELCSQSPATLNRLHIKMPGREDVMLLPDPETGKTGFNAHFTPAVSDKSSLGYLTWVLPLRH